MDDEGTPLFLGAPWATEEDDDILPAGQYGLCKMSIEFGIRPPIACLL